jgi:surface antigen
MAAVRLSTPSFSKMWIVCFFTVATLRSNGRGVLDIESGGDLLDWTGIAQASGMGAWATPASGAITQDEDGHVVVP